MMVFWGNKKGFIEIEGGITKKLLRIKAAGKVAWAIATDKIGIAAKILISGGGIGDPISSLIGIGTVSVLGSAASVSNFLLQLPLAELAH